MKLTGDRNQCATCSEYFNRTSGFDRHRVGKIGGTPSRRCLSVDEMDAAGFTKNGAGFWLAPMSERDRARREYRFQPAGKDQTRDGVERVGVTYLTRPERAFGVSLHVHG